MQKRAVVTGLSHGLGAFIGARLAQEGWRVTGFGRSELNPVPEGIEYFQADLSSVEAVSGLADRIGPTPDLVIHCAVSYPGSKSTLTLPDMGEVFRVNALAPYQLTLELLAAKPPDKFLSCVVVNSEAIYQADNQSGVYAASKAALRVLTTALAAECRDNHASTATLLLGPLASLQKTDDLRSVATKRGLTEEEITRIFLRKSNSNLVINSLIDFDAAWKSVQYIESLGATANGMLCKLDGGSSGSLI